MTANIFQEFNALLDVLPEQDLYEVRIENNGSGQAVYIGKSIIPNAPTDAFVWSLLKCTYDGSNFLVRKQLPTLEQGFKYTWDDRASAFS